MSLASAEDNHASSELARVLARVEARNLEVLGVDLTVADVESCGYRVVKVLVPGAQQLHGDHSHRFLGGERLYRVPVELGFPGPRSFETLNPDPHPYP
jgi:ribosomal protein S12 methylthiotransferase accessory factor YcaO